jgi:hypothetical protein
MSKEITKYWEDTVIEFGGADRCEKDNTLTINKQEVDVKDNFTTDEIMDILNNASSGCTKQ